MIKTSVFLRNLPGLSSRDDSCVPGILSGDAIIHLGDDTAILDGIDPASLHEDNFLVV